MESQIERRLFNVEEYYRMAEVGIFSPDECIELLDGEIFKKNKSGRRHASCIMRLTHVLIRRLDSSAIVSVHNPVRLDEFSEPEPDIALLKPKANFYQDGHPIPDDVLLMSEVADANVNAERTVKMPLYARSKIPQAVIVNLSSDAVEVYSKPVKGKYTKVQLLKRGQSLKILKLPDLMLTVDEILG